jgi:hypothetical protein
MELLEKTDNQNSRNIFTINKNTFKDKFEFEVN